MLASGEKNDPMAIFTFMNGLLPMMKKLKKLIRSAKNSKVKLSREIRSKLGRSETGKTKACIELEKKLDKWLAQRSLAQILDWFDCIETTNVQTAMGNCRWSTESVSRDRLFLDYLGVNA